MADVYIAIGANLGDRVSTLDSALRLLEELPGSTILSTAGRYETVPVGGPAGQDKYLNSACRMATSLEPLPFLRELHNIERRLGRRRESEIRWGPRTIDLDILLWGDMLIDDPELVIPHPRMAEREFVLQPLMDIAADAVHPVLGKTVRELLEMLENSFPR